jgi:hypothetical protein
VAFVRVVVVFDWPGSLVCSRGVTGTGGRELVACKDRAGTVFLGVTGFDAEALATFEVKVVSEAAPWPMYPLYFLRLDRPYFSFMGVSDQCEFFVCI